MQLTVDPNSGVPTYEQIRTQIAAHILAGTLGPGHRLPSIRQLARDLAVAPGTVARAYNELEATKLISTSRTHGSRVLGEVALPQSELVEGARRLVAQAKRNDLDEEQLVALIHAAWRRRKTR